MKILNVVLVVLLLAVCVYAYTLQPKNKSNPVEAAKVVPVDVKQEIVGKYVDSLAKETHVKFTDKQKNLPASALTDGTISPVLVDSIARQLGIKDKQITSYVKFTIKSEGEKIAAVKSRDSLQRIVWRSKSPFIEQSFTEPDSSNPGGTFGYKYRNTIKATQYNSKKILGIPVGQDIIDISSPDPNADFNGASAFSIKPTQPFFGASLQAIGNYNLRTKEITPGFGGQLRFGRAYLTGAYYYNISSRVFSPIVGVRYDVLRYPTR